MIRFLPESLSTFTVTTAAALRLDPPVRTLSAGLELEPGRGKTRCTGEGGTAVNRSLILRGGSVSSGHRAPTAAASSGWHCAREAVVLDEAAGGRSTGAGE
ncbi:unnamed protein product [Pleuronectes platessa]|uniref:Uncharacterized protein n=1 Tax=Pleuronectes platessa TaxID=8262 RepID=A0A9N7YAQ7_PLEPL|nr:unnamed protein product [Pleuronectes platessa]